MADLLIVVGVIAALFLAFLWGTTVPCDPQYTDAEMQKLINAVESIDDDPVDVLWMEWVDTEIGVKLREIAEITVKYHNDSGVETYLMDKLEDTKRWAYGA